MQTSCHGISEVLAKAVQAGRNVLLEGRFGVGKSSLVLGIAQELKMGLKYFSAPTLDPFADLVGIPVPVLEGEERRILYLRPGAVNTAEILFFDELNRAPARVLNAVFEIIQFRTINGEKLPKLRSVIAAINPPENGHHIQELDRALLDRFHLYLTLDPGPSRRWFQEQFGPEIGSTLVDWYENDLDDAQRKGLSNRRLEYLGRCLQDKIDLIYALPAQTNLPLHLLDARLQGGSGVLSVEHFISSPERFASLVKSDLNVAFRFAHLLPLMVSKELCQVREITLALPAEVQTMIAKSFPFVYRQTVQAITHFLGAVQADLFKKALEKILRQAPPDRVQRAVTLELKA